jgi:hypothetical protein
MAKRIVRARNGKKFNRIFLNKKKRKKILIYKYLKRLDGSEVLNDSMSMHEDEVQDQIDTKLNFAQNSAEALKINQGNKDYGRFAPTANANITSGAVPVNGSANYAA